MKKNPKQRCFCLVLREVGRGWLSPWLCPRCRPRPGRRPGPNVPPSTPHRPDEPPPGHTGPAHFVGQMEGVVSLVVETDLFPGQQRLGRFAHGSELRPRSERLPFVWLALGGFGYLRPRFSQPNACEPPGSPLARSWGLCLVAWSGPGRGLCARFRPPIAPPAWWGVPRR